MNNININSIYLQNNNGNNAVLPYYYNLFNNKNKYIINYNENYFDKINIKAIIFESNNIIQINDFYSILQNNNIIFNITMNNNIIFKSSLSLFLNFHPVKKYNNKFVIFIENYLLNDFICYNNKLVYYLESEINLYQYFNEIKLLMDVTILTNNNKILFNQLNTDHFIQTILSKKIFSLNNNIREIFDITNVYIKGIFIEYNDINNIQNITINIDGSKRFDFDNFLLDMYSFKISNDLIYISFDNTLNYEKKCINSFSNSFFMKNISKVNLSMSFLNNNNFLSIYFLIGDYIKITDGKYILDKDYIL